MVNFIPKTPIQIQIRKIIFENYNNVEEKFTNDDIFAKIKQTGDFDSSWIIDDMEKYFHEICDSGMVRNIAQNFTTMWFMIFEPIKQMHCNSCNFDVYLGSSETSICPNPDCKNSI
jgi:hypothetical protein